MRRWNEVAQAMDVRAASEDRIELDWTYHTVCVLNPDAFLRGLGGGILDEVVALGSATRLLSTALAQSPCREDLRLLLNRSVKKHVRRWHFRMMNDDTRNDAYQAAIAAAVQPGSIVPDIGTGAGHVYSCEQDPLLAELARQIIERNDMRDSITVLDGSSLDLAVGEQFPAPADVLVTEIFDCGLLGESALGALADATRRLLAPGATLLPRGATLYGELVESPGLHELNHVGQVCGSGLSSFNALDLAPGPTLSSGPCDPPTHWRQAVQTMRIPIPLSEGEAVSLIARHNGNRVRIWFED